MSIAHGIRTLGVLGGGQMGMFGSDLIPCSSLIDFGSLGTGIALVSALHAKVPVLLHDRSKEQINKGLLLVDKLLAKDVGKGRLTDTQAKEARERITVVDSLEGLRDVDMVVEVLVPFLSPLHNTRSSYEHTTSGRFRKPCTEATDLRHFLSNLAS